MEVTSDGLSFQAMDVSNIALVTLQLDQKGFQKYQFYQNMTLGIKIQNLHKILRCARDDDIITLQCDEDPQTLAISFEDRSQTKISKFVLNLMQNEDESYNMTSVDYSTQIELPSKEFINTIRELNILSETIKITSSKNQVAFSISGDITDGEVIYKENNMDKEHERVIIEVDDEGMSHSFSLYFL